MNVAKVTPQEYADKWARRTAAAVPDYRAGVARVTEAPGQKAAAKVDKMRQNVNAALDSGKWESRVAGVTLPEWKSAAIEKGAARIGAGVEAAKGDMVRFGTELLQHTDTVAAEVAAMPDLSLADRIQRAVHNMTRMAEFSRS